jgi:hypothetical protein
MYRFTWWGWGWCSYTFWWSTWLRSFRRRCRFFIGWLFTERFFKCSYNLIISTFINKTSCFNLRKKNEIIVEREWLVLYTRPNFFQPNNSRNSCSSLT